MNLCVVDDVGGVVVGRPELVAPAMTSSSDLERHVTGYGRVITDDTFGEGMDEIIRVRNSRYIYFICRMQLTRRSHTVGLRRH